MQRLKSSGGNSTQLDRQSRIIEVGPANVRNEIAVNFFSRFPRSLERFDFERAFRVVVAYSFEPTIHS